MLSQFINDAHIDWFWRSRPPSKPSKHIQTQQMPRLQQLQGQGPSQGNQHAGHGNSLAHCLLPGAKHRNRQPTMGENLQKDLNVEEIKLAAELWDCVIDIQMLISRIENQIVFLGLEYLTWGWMSIQRSTPGPSWDQVADAWRHSLQFEMNLTDCADGRTDETIILGVADPPICLWKETLGPSKILALTLSIENCDNNSSECSVLLGFEFWVSQGAQPKHLSKELQRSLPIIHTIWSATDANTLLEHFSSVAPETLFSELLSNHVEVKSNH